MDEEIMSFKGTDRFKAYQCMVLVQPSAETPHPAGMIIVGSPYGGLKRGIVLDCGSEVPELQEGDLIYFQEEIPLEDDLVAVHYQEVVTYKRYE
jgi:hypothetical protein